MSGEREQAQAWRAELDTLLDQWAAFDYDDVPATPPAIYVLVSVTRRYGGDRRNAGKRPLIGWRLTTMAVGHTTDEARWARDKIAALEGVMLPALDASPLEFEDETPIEPDDGRQSGMTSWTYVTPS